MNNLSGCWRLQGKNRGKYGAVLFPPRSTNGVAIIRREARDHTAKASQIANTQTFRKQ